MEGLRASNRGGRMIARDNQKPEPVTLEAARGRESFRGWHRKKPAQAMSRETRLTLGPAARYLKVTPRLLRRWTEQGRVPYVRVRSRRGPGVSRHWNLYLPSDLDRVLVVHECE